MFPREGDNPTTSKEMAIGRLSMDMTDMLDFNFNGCVTRNDFKADTNE